MTDRFVGTKGNCGTSQVSEDAVSLLWHKFRTYGLSAITPRSLWLFSTTRASIASCFERS